MEDEDGERPAVEDEPQPDEAREAQLALENAGLGDGNGPVPDRRGVQVDAPVAQAGQDAQDDAEDADTVGVPVVEDEDDTNDDEDATGPSEDEALSAGVREEEEQEEDVRSAGVRDDESAEDEEQLGERRYPARL